MPSITDRFDDDQCRIKVQPSGGYFHLYNEGDTSQIHLLDIASALGRQCRFTGHLLPDFDHYSVAEHCVLVADIVEHLEGSPWDVFGALMHDAPEAYLSDIAAPFKRELGPYYDKEELIWQRIAKKYDLPKKLPKLIKDADWLALFIEARSIIVREEDDLRTWAGYYLDDVGPKSKNLPFDIHCWDRKTATQNFLTRFAICQDKINDYPTAINS